MNWKIIEISARDPHSFVGKKINRWTILEYVGTRGSNGRKDYFFKCQCECGAIRKVIGNRIKDGKSKSCGCYRKEKTIKTNTTHRMYGTREYKAWANMLSRCRNSKLKAYPRYGGRGIKVCNRWLKFENFLTDMGKCPSNKHTIERINNDGNYQPSNCEWIHISRQTSNTCRSVKITYKGETKTITDWAKIVGLSADTLRHRLRVAKWSIEDAFNIPRIPLELRSKCNKGK